VVVVDTYVPNSVAKRREEISRAYDEYVRLKVQRQADQDRVHDHARVSPPSSCCSRPPGSASYIARRITVPIQRLAEGTRAVAQGDLDHRISGESQDEIGTLVSAFNRMTAELENEPHGARLAAALPRDPAREHHRRRHLDGRRRPDHDAQPCRGEPARRAGRGVHLAPARRGARRGSRTRRSAS